jgi:CHAD domain-containing protein
MAYRLKFDEPLATTLHRTAVELFDDAITVVTEDLDDDPVEAVHEVRKDLKKARSLLRLARPGIPRSAYRRENRYLRDTARAISAARDADVMVETVDALAERYAGRLPKRTFTTLRGRLAKQATGGALPGAEGLLEALQEARARVDGWGLDGCDEAALTAGAVRAYARGRAALAAVGDDASAVRLHEWRKRVKDLWYHQRLLRNAWKGPLRALADESHRLADLLGDDHDLAVLADRLVASPELTAGSALLDREAILSLIAERRAELQAEARRLGRRVYAEKRKAHGRRMGRYLAAAHAQAGETADVTA